MTNSNQNINSKISIEEIRVQISILGFIKILELISHNPSRYFIQGILFRLRYNRLPTQSDFTDYSKIPVLEPLDEYQFRRGAEKFDKILEEEREESELLTQESQEFEASNKAQERQRGPYKLNDQVIQNISKALQDGTPVTEIAEKLKLSRMSIYRLLRQKIN